MFNTLNSDNFVEIIYLLKELLVEEYPILEFQMGNYEQLRSFNFRNNLVPTLNNSAIND